MWQSHGFYFEPKLNRWEWQRARIFQTVEDLYTQSFVMPYLMPMLENAGAYVMSPRERDTRRAELIVDNNEAALQPAPMRRATARRHGATAAQVLHTRQRHTRISRIRSATAPSARLRRQRAKTHRPLRGRPTYPRQGRMPSTFPTPLFQRRQRKPSTPFKTAGGDKQFQVNQRMGGGTWIYLGHFDLAAGSHAVVTLTSKDRKSGEVVTADAVKMEAVWATSSVGLPTISRKSK